MQPLILRWGQVEQGLESSFKVINNFLSEHSTCPKHNKGRPAFWSIESVSKIFELRFL